MADPDPYVDTSADYEQFERAQLAQDRDITGIETADVDDEAWLVPVMGLSDTTNEREVSRKEATIPSKKRLDCQHCGRSTAHRFSTHDSVPDENWGGQLIWECQVCGTARYGPALE